MRLAFHPKVASDILKIIGYYEEAAGQQLAEEFHAELRLAFQKAAEAGPLKPTCGRGARLAEDISEQLVVMLWARCSRQLAVRTIGSAERKYAQPLEVAS